MRRAFTLLELLVVVAVIAVLAALAYPVVVTFQEKGRAVADIPELTTLAETIDTWWPAIQVFLATGITNARTEGANRLIKQVKRADSGFRNRENYRRRVRLHCTRRTRRLSARKPTVPA
jgi:prepilin-type N-terminal cleavage/methylation domain-containing protein